MLAALRRVVQRVLLPEYARTQRRQEKVLTGLQRRLHHLQVWAKEHERFVSTFVVRSEAVTARQVEQQRLVRRTIRLTASDRPIIVGPWTGEVGFELLYWIPFLNRIVRRRAIDRTRLVIVSRGGTLDWYRHLADRYVEVLDRLTAEEFRTYGESPRKQRQLLPLDGSLIRWAARSAGVSRPHVLHPQLMYRLLIPYWKGEPALESIGEYLDYRSLERPSEPLPPGLPREYVAVKFYFSNSFPDTPANRTFVARTIDTLSRRTDVVLLTSGTRLDDHADAAIESGTRVTPFRVESTRNNLAVQSAIIARASAFVGTYGGFSYLAPFYGVRSLSFYSHPDQFVRFHLDHAGDVFTRMRAGFVALDTAQAEFVGDFLGNELVGVGSPARSLQS